LRRVSLLLVALLAGCASTAARQAFDPTQLRAIDATIDAAIAAHELPGGIFHLERDGAVYQRAYGHRALVPTPERMTDDTIFDAASLTKVVATTPAIWLLIERGKLSLDDPVSTYLPDFPGDITIRHLLTHTSGLRAGIPPSPPWSGYDAGIALAMREQPLNRPGYVFRYSDINFILLGEIVRRVAGEPLDLFADREIYRPLRMRDTGFHPDAALLPRIAPTENVAGEGMLRGRVHDPTVRRMGGVAGSAGLFTTVADLSRYVRMLLGGGQLDGVRILRAETVAQMTALQSPPNVAVRRAGGWDLDSGFSRPRGALFPLGSFGHTGFTGGMLWIDPTSRTFYIFLSNRVHPDGRGSVTRLQYQLGTLAARAVRHADFTHALLPPRTGGTIEPILGGAEAMNGIDMLESTGYAALRGLRVGLITNHTGIDRSGNPTIDLLRSAPGVTLVSLFSPEHGIRGTADEKVGDTTDPASSLPLYSLYGERKAPTPEQLANLDALVFDIQDVGTRFYTYIATMGHAMEAAAKAHVRFLVLDRVDPIGGAALEGPLPEGESKFTAFHPIPVRHGMTVGELAQMFNNERKVGVQLEVIRLRGWKRPQWQDDAGLPWINTSPNMRSLTAAGLYPGIGLLESALSVGRGTGEPFLVAGAPYIDEQRLVADLRALNLPGIVFEPTRFTPTASTFKGEECHGVRFRVTDRATLQPVKVGVAIATILQRLYPEKFALDKIAPLLMHKATLEAIRTGQPLETIVALWTDDEAAFRTRRARYLLYPE
jgi:uncharacterized protein YbbC (DUF1343 family)/CubicO group peptidase (beta-lactamase class C family)